MLEVVELLQSESQGVSSLHLRHDKMVKKLETTPVNRPDRVVAQRWHDEHASTYTAGDGWPSAHG